MLIIYQRQSAKEIRDSIPDAIKQLEGWFAANPKRNECNAQLWYGNITSIQRDKITEGVNAEDATSMAKVGGITHVPSDTETTEAVKGR